MTSLTALLVKWGTILIGILGAILGIYARGKRSGVEQQRAKLKAATDATQKEFNRIDHRDDSFDDAINSLQERSRHSD